MKMIDGRGHCPSKQFAGGHLVPLMIFRYIEACRAR